MIVVYVVKPSKESAVMTIPISVEELIVVAFTTAVEMKSLSKILTIFFAKTHLEFPASS